MAKIESQELYQSYIDEYKRDLELMSARFDFDVVRRYFYKMINYWEDKIDELYKINDYTTINRGFA